MRKLLTRLLLALVIVAPLVAVVFAWAHLAPSQVYAASMGLERFLGNLETAQIEVDGGVVVYSRGGEGPALLLLHGFGADRDHFNRIAADLGEHFSLAIPDLPGFGRSERPAGRFTIPAQTDRVLAFVDKLGWDKFHVGGSSMGGYLATSLASAAPERVLSMWLLAPGGVAGAQPSEMIERITSGQSNPLIPREPDEFEQTIDFVFHHRPFVPGPVLRYLGAQAIEQRQFRDRVFADITESFEQRPTESYLRDTRQPALVTWGEEDRVLHPSGATVLEALRSGIAVIRMTGVGHLPMLESPAETVRGYLDWQVAATGEKAASATTSP